MREDKKTWRVWHYGKPHKGQSGEKVPHYCKKANEWRCMVSYPWTERNYEERGDIEYVMGEFSQYGETYHFETDKKPAVEGYTDHEHSFAGVLATLLFRSMYFQVEGFEQEYSRQQLEMIRTVREKLISMGKKNEL